MTEFVGFGEFADGLRDFADETREAQSNVEDAFARALLRVAQRMAGEASRLAPKDTGRLARSIEVYRRGVLSYGYGTDVGYGPDQEYGTAPHAIRPDEADVLSWPDPETGEQVFAAKVDHPGNDPQPFIRPSFETYVDDLDAEVWRELGGVFASAYS